MDTWLVSISFGHALTDTGLEVVGGYPHQFSYLKDYSTCYMEMGFRKIKSGKRNDV